MPASCSRCNRMKLFEKGWISESGKLYCPDCWAIILTEREAEMRKFKEELKRWSEEAKCKQDRIMVQIDEIRQQLELYSSGKMPLQDEFTATSIILAQYGLSCIDNALAIKENDLKRLEENFERIIIPVVKPIVVALNRITMQDDSTNINDLIYLCLDLIKVRDIHLMYVSDIEFPVDIMIQLFKVDRATTLKKLCQIVCDSNVEPRVKNIFITALGRIGDKKSVDTLLNLLKEDNNDWGMINSAACALADIGDERAVITIIGAIERHLFTGNFQDWTARDYIAERIGKLVRPGTNLYQEICNKWKQLKETFGDTELNTTKRWAVLPVLEKVLVDSGGYEAVEIAAEWARSGNNEVALKGTKALANLDYEEALDVLCYILVTPCEVYDEGDFWDKRYHYLNNEQRVLAAKALAQRDCPKARVVLQNVASDKETEVRDVVRQLLSNL